MLDLEFVRNSSWIYDILTSGIGLGVFVAVLGILLSSNNNVDLLEVLSVTSESKEQKEKIDRIRKKSRTKNYIRIIISVFLLLVLVVISGVKFYGYTHMEDVFNGKYKYVGQTMNNKAEGIGRKYTNDNYLVYDGEFEANNYEGEGKYYYNRELDGTKVTRLKYVGEFKVGHYSGKGKMYYAYAEDVDEDGNELPQIEYEGDFRDGAFNGEGKGYSYSLKPGIEKATKASDYYCSSTYEGEWSDGYGNGKGERLVYDVNGNIVERYSGYFKDGNYMGVVNDGYRETK